MNGQNPTRIGAVIVEKPKTHYVSLYPQDYSKGKRCGACRNPVTNSNKTGFCIHCRKGNAKYTPKVTNPPSNLKEAGTLEMPQRPRPIKRIPYETETIKVALPEGITKEALETYLNEKAKYTKGRRRSHTSLKEEAKRVLKAWGCQNITEELEIKIGNERVIFDMVGENLEGKLIIIECGELSTAGGRVKKILNLLDRNTIYKIYHLPYYDNSLYEWKLTKVELPET